MEQRSRFTSAVLFVLSSHIALSARDDPKRVSRKLSLPKSRRSTVVVNCVGKKRRRRLEGQILLLKNEHVTTGAVIMFQVAQHEKCRRHENSTPRNLKIVFDYSRNIVLKC